MSPKTSRRVEKDTITMPDYHALLDVFLYLRIEKTLQFMLNVRKKREFLKKSKVKPIAVR